MIHRPNYGSWKSEKQLQEEFEAEEMRKAGKNKAGGTGHKMSDAKRLKNRKKRK